MDGLDATAIIVFILSQTLLIMRELGRISARIAALEERIKAVEEAVRKS